MRFSSSQASNIDIDGDHRTLRICCWRLAGRHDNDSWKDASLLAQGSITSDGRPVVVRIHHETRPEPHDGFEHFVVVEVLSGKRYRAIWEYFGDELQQPVNLHFSEIDPNEPKPSSNTVSCFGLLLDNKSYIGAAEAECVQYPNTSRAWILDTYRHQILRVPPAYRGYARWHCNGSMLLIIGRDHRLTLVDFTNSKGQSSRE